MVQLLEGRGEIPACTVHTSAQNQAGSTGTTVRFTGAARRCTAVALRSLLCVLPLIFQGLQPLVQPSLVDLAGYSAARDARASANERSVVESSCACGKVAAAAYPYVRPFSRA